MGLVAGAIPDQLRGRRIYLDANVFIYALEGKADVKAQVAPLFAALDAEDMDGVTSDLSLAEVLVHPYRIGHTALADRYERLLAPRINLARIPVSLSLWRAAAHLRARTKLRLPDAVHLATAEAAQCAFIVTNDQGIMKASRIPVVLVEETSA